MSNDCNKSGMLGYDRIADCWSVIGSTAERGASGPICPLMADQPRTDIDSHRGCFKPIGRLKIQGQNKTVSIRNRPPFERPAATLVRSRNMTLQDQSVYCGLISCTKCVINKWGTLGPICPLMALPPHRDIQFP